MPWSNQIRRLQKIPKEEDVDIKKMFDIAKHDVF